MAKTKVVKSPKASKSTKNVYKPGTKLSAHQQYKIAKGNQSVAKLKTNRAAANIKATGQALAQVTTPFAAQTTATRITEAKEVTKRADNQQAALDVWKSLMGGNPSKESGTEGSAQGNTVGNAGGGSILGG